MRGHSNSMAAERLTTITERWIRERLKLKRHCLGDVGSLSLPGTYEEKIRHIGSALRNFVRLKTLDLSCNALVSVQGLHHLKMLKRLNLYYNCISSMEEVKPLCDLPALTELDLRLNPFTKNDPHYRLYLVHTMSSLRKLDDCPVRDTERKVAIIQFSSFVPQQEQPSLNPAVDQRSSAQRLASVDCLTKKLSLLDATDDVVLNFVTKLKHYQKPRDGYVSEPESSTSQKQETTKSILRYSEMNHGPTQSKVPQMTESSQKKSSTSSKVTDKPKVSFGPYVEKYKPVSRKPKQKGFSGQTRLPAAKGHFTPNPGHLMGNQCSSPMNTQPPSPTNHGLNLSDPSNPVLHPPRVSYSSFDRTAGGVSQPQKAHQQRRRGGYRKPLEMLLNLVDKHWAGERSLHHNNNFLSEAVKIFSMMENDISSREAEVRALRGEVDALSQQADVREEAHKLEVRNLSSQLEEAQNAVDNLNEQLRIVLKENVALQRQQIKLEQQYLKSVMNNSPITQIKEAQTEVARLRKEIEGLREKVWEAEKVKELADMLQESHRSLVATNEHLLGGLKSNGERC
ncbi:centrosomal protein of 72 kDa [Lampris incognitus]|uniref:centrosomal protein of 72 kDa n=1 Tax=Lampris incognitus TaxID=2546036 RepID=UPI0024B5633D|nr:centrosomal protein of 72 kDa [Lampris incognitus]